MFIRFVYRFQGTEHESKVRAYLKDGNDRFIVELPDGRTCVIAAAGLRGEKGKILWCQVNTCYEKIESYDLLQAMGEGLELLFN
jgi:hypothetical protein